MKILSRLVLIPLTLLAGLVTIFLAIANRHTVSFSFDPFDIDAPALAVDLPLFVLILISVFVGLLIGGGSAWMGQRGWRKSARDKRATLTRLEKAQTTRPAASSALTQTQATAPNVMTPAKKDLNPR